jgi:hypothetical protein
VSAALAAEAVLQAGGRVPIDRAVGWARRAGKPDLAARLRAAASRG